MITNRGLSDDPEKRQKELKEKIDELSFCLSKVPMKKGSGTFFAVILNLDNGLEERAFIREYKTFDPYADVIFVTSDFKMLTGNLEPIAYDGEQIDTIFMPMIQWQKNRL